MGDDFGRVTLTDFPCLTSSELRLSPFAAHHGPVSSLSFSHDGSLLLSSGLRDGCLLVWQIIDIPSDDFEPSPHLLRVLRKFESPYHVPPVSVEERQDIFEQVPDYVVGLMKPVDRTEAGALEGLHSLPHQKLQLQYVYNKRGYDSFQDVRVLNSGELVYFAAGEPLADLQLPLTTWAAAIAVVHDISADGQLDRQRFFTRHRHEIGCLCVHPDGCMVATGDLHSTSSVYVWNADTLYYDLSERDYCSSTTIQLRVPALECWVGCCRLTCLLLVEHGGSRCPQLLRRQQREPTRRHRARRLLVHLRVEHRAGSSKDPSGGRAEEAYSVSYLRFQGIKTARFLWHQPHQVLVTSAGPPVVSPHLLIFQDAGREEDCLSTWQDGRPAGQARGFPPD